MPLILCSCRGDIPFDYPLTKWECGDLKLYVKERGSGYFVCEYADQKIIFDADFPYGNELFIYKHRESAEQEVEIVATYHPVGMINNSKRSDFSLARLTDESYADVFTERICLRKVADITPDDFEYDFFDVTTEEWTKAHRDEDRKDNTEDSSLC